MRFATVSRNLVFGMDLLLASGAWAGTKASLELNRPVVVMDRLSQREITNWSGKAVVRNVELIIMRGGHVAAKVPARVVELETAPARDAVLTWTNDCGPNTLTGVQFRGKRIGLELTEAGEGTERSSR